MSSQTIKEDIAITLSVLNRIYFSKVDNPNLGGSSYIDTKATDGIFVGNFQTNVMKMLMGSQYNSQTPLSEFNTNISDSTTVHVLTKGSLANANAKVYASIDISNWQSNIYDKISATGDNKVIDINVFNLMSDPNGKRTLNALYALHDLSSDAKWTSLKDAFEMGDLSKVEVSIGSIDPSTNKNLKVALDSDANDANSANIARLLGDNWKAELQKFVENERFIPFALRRLTYLYIRMFQFYIALSVMNQAINLGNQGTNLLSAGSYLAQAIYAMLENDLNVIENDTMIRVSEGVANRISRYNAYSKEVNSLNDRYGETRDYVKANSERLGSETKYESKARVMLFASIGVLIIALMVSAGSVIIDMDMKQKMMIAGGGLAFAAISGLILFVVFTKQVVEGFEVTRSAFASTTFSLNNVVEGTISDYNTAILELARDYLQVSNQLIQNINTYRSFGNTTYTMAKEYRYFLDHNVTLRNAGDKYKAAHRASDLYQKKYGATLYLCILIAIISAATAIAYIGATEKLPFVQPYVLGVGGAVVFVIFVIYMLEITGYVRTDGDKKYWGRPVSTNL